MHLLHLNSVIGVQTVGLQALPDKPLLAGEEKGFQDGTSAATSIPATTSRVNYEQSEFFDLLQNQDRWTSLMTAVQVAGDTVPELLTPRQPIARRPKSHSHDKGR